MTLDVTDPATLAQRSAQALGWSWAGALLRAVLQFGVQIGLARLLGPEAFGQAAAALLVVGFFALIGEAGMSSALIQRQELQAHDPGAAMACVLLVSSCVALGVWLISAPLAAQLGDTGLQPLVWAAAAIVPLQACSTLPQALLQRRFEVKRLQAVQLVGYLFAYGGVGLSLAAAGAGAWSVLAAFALHALLVGLFTLGGSGQSWRPRWAGSQALRAYGLRITAANLVNWGLESLDRLLVSRSLGPAALGAYSVAATLARAPVTLLVSSAQPVAFAAAARLQDQNHRLARGYLAVLALALLVAVPLFVYLAWFARPVVELLYGPAWQAAAAPFAWLCLGVPFFVMLALTGPMLRGVDAVGSEMRAQLAVLVLLALALWAASGQSLAVIAALVSLATLLRAAMLARALTSRLGMATVQPWRAWRGALVLGVLVSAIAWIAQRVLADEASAALACALVSLAAIALALRLGKSALLGDELVLAITNRRGDSALATRVCAWMGLG